MTYSFDPELALVVPALPTSDLEDPVAARAWLRDLLAQAPAPDTTGVQIADRRIGGDLPVRIYRPEGTAAVRPAVLAIHGGGFVVGDVETNHGMSVEMARLGAVVVSVDYRLAPEHPYPAAIEDCYTALQWLSGAHAELGVDPDRIAAHGVSAGGGLAAALALLARDRGGPALCFQFLAEPMLDDRAATPSAQTYTDTPLMTRLGVQQSWRHYLGAAPAEVSPYAAPARATDVSGLPPAYVLTMEFDPLRDEGVAYAVRLQQAGVSVQLHSVAGTFHGSELIATAAISRLLVAERDLVLRRALGLTTP